MITYKQWIEQLKKEWIGRQIPYEGKLYTVIDVDYNGSLLIDKPNYYNDSYTADHTAVERYQFEI